MKKHYWFTIWILVVSILLISACSSNSTDKVDEGSNNVNEPITLTYWEPLAERPEDIDREDFWVRRAVDMFEDQYPHITIDYVVHNWSQEYDATFRAAGIAGNGPDVSSHFPGGVLFSFSNFLEPLDDHLSSETLDSLTAWDQVRNDFDAEGEILGIPAGAGTYFNIFYNKSLFEEVGIGSDYVPSTWEELLETAQKFKKAGITPFVAGESQGHTGAWMMTPLVGSLIGVEGLFDMYHGEIDITDESMVRSYEQWRKAEELGLLNEDYLSLKAGEATDAFLAGEGAMHINGWWSNHVVESAMGDNVSAFPIPALADAKYDKVLAGGPAKAYIVSNYSDHIEESVLFAEFMASKEVQDMYVEQMQREASNHLDADTSLIDSPLLQTQAKWLEDYELIMGFDSIMPQEVNGEFYRVNTQVLAGQISPEEATKRLQDELERVRERMSE